jgi:hypothetical protein
MSRIFKYRLALTEREMIQTHEGVQFLSVGLQDGFVCVWGIVDESRPIKPHILRLVTTGEVFNSENCEFIGTFQYGSPTWFMGHIFHQVGVAPDPISPRFKDDFKQIRAEQEFGEDAPVPQ